MHVIAGLLDEKRIQRIVALVDSSLSRQGLDALSNLAELVGQIEVRDLEEVADRVSRVSVSSHEAEVRDLEQVADGDTKLANHEWVRLDSNKFAARLLCCVIIIIFFSASSSPSPSSSS